MRYALPLWHCLDYDTQVKLAPLLHDAHSIPPPIWQEWPAPEVRFDITPLDIRSIEEAEEYYNKFMRQAPSRSRG